jgi:arsenite-transporting ATPase
MQFLLNAPRFLFFTGKGGVGKTSSACATAIHLTEDRKRVLLVSTDPASNVGQVFSVNIGNDITALDAVPGLSALEIDPEAAAQGYRDRIVGPLRGVLPEDVVRGMEEQLSGACTTEIAAFDEFTGLLTDAGLVAKFDHIVFDTAPTGHTIRLLQLPGAWNDYLEAGKGDASCLGPLAGLDKQRAQYNEAVKALADSRHTRLILVARAQPSALREVERTREELGRVGLNQQYLVLNAVMPENETHRDALAAAIYAREQAAWARIPDGLRTLPRDQVALQPFDIVGVPALRKLFVLQVTQTSANADEAPVIDLPALATLIDDIAADGHGLVMLWAKAASARRRSPPLSPWRSAHRGCQCISPPRIRRRT